MPALCRKVCSWKTKIACRALRIQALFLTKTRGIDFFLKTNNIFLISKALNSPVVYVSRKIVQPKIAEKFLHRFVPGSGPGPSSHERSLSLDTR
jgi:hypothetical protein